MTGPTNDECDISYASPDAQEKINHGKPIPICKSNILDPRVLLTAIGASPLRAAIIVDMQSGIDVPNARNVVPSRMCPTPV